MDKKKNILVAGACISGIALIGLITVLLSPAPAIAEEQKDVIEFEGVSYPETLHEEEGFVDFASWYTALREKKEEYIGFSDRKSEEYGEYLTEEENALLLEYENQIQTVFNFAELNAVEENIDSVISNAENRKAEEEERIRLEEEAAAQAQMQAQAQAVVANQQPESQSYYIDSNGKLTASGGVNYYNGRKETWYSSNVLYHYRTPEWTCGADGVYRDADGYVVVAASDLPQNSIIDTSYGPGKVLDSGCGANVTDIYTNW